MNVSDHKADKKCYISVSMRLMATKLDKMVAYDKES